MPCRAKTFGLLLVPVPSGRGYSAYSDAVRTAGRRLLAASFAELYNLLHTADVLAVPNSVFCIL